MNIGTDAGEVIPDSIKSIVLTRMDQLSRTDNRALRAASILGQRFQLTTLRFLIDEPEYRIQYLRMGSVHQDLYFFHNAFVKF